MAEHLAPTKRTADRVEADARLNDGVIEYIASAVAMHGWRAGDHVVLFTSDDVTFLADVEDVDLEESEAFLRVW